MSTEAGGQYGSQPSEEELRAAYEAEIKKLRVEHILLDQVVTLVNLGMRRTGLQPGTEDERDLEQVRIAIDAIRALLPLLERAAPEQVVPVRDALSQLQLAFVRIGGTAAAGAPGAAAAATPAGGESAASGEPSAVPAGDAPAAPDGEEAAGPAQATEPQRPGEPGPAQRSGRLWVPGQR